ncbi:MAG TPA: OmpH family outer membrane protein [Bryobacteraceae bacterium]|nr:OmpH family outer membrane protein [Bryobacteraceae bacterium]
MLSRFFLLPALALAALSASAQKMAVIDMQGAILQTNDGKKASAELKAKYDPVQQALAKRGQDLQAKQQQYQKNSAAMSDADKATAERELQELGAKLKRDADDARQDATAEQNKALGPILQRLDAVMRKYASEKQITMIVDLSAQPNNLLMSAASVNITNDIIALYNQPQAGPAPSSLKPPAATSPAGTNKTPAPPAASKK